MKIQDFLLKEKLGKDNFDKFTHRNELYEDIQIKEGKKYIPSNRLSTLTNKLNEGSLLYKYANYICETLKKIETRKEDEVLVEANSYLGFELSRTYKKFADASRHDKENNKETIGKILGATKFAISYLFEEDAESYDEEMHEMIHQYALQEFEETQELI